MKTIEFEAEYPHKFTKYDNGDVKARCITCDEEKEMSAETFSKFSRIPRDINRHWTQDFECTDCFINRREAVKRGIGQAKRNEYVEGAEWGMAYNLASTKALKDHDMKLDSTFFGIVEDNHQKILSHIKEFKQKTLHQ